MHHTDNITSTVNNFRRNMDDVGTNRLDTAADDEENVMQCAYGFLMRATSLMTQLQCHLDGEVNSAQLPPPTTSNARCAKSYSFFSSPFNASSKNEHFVTTKILF